FRWTGRASLPAPAPARSPPEAKAALRPVRGSPMNRFPRAGWLVALSILAACGTGPARAALPDSARVVLQDTVVVSSTKLRFRLSALATSARVIPASAIRLGTARQTQDVLASVPGTHVADLTGTETGGVVEARGYASQGTSSHLLVLVDEIPVNEFE